MAGVNKYVTPKAAKQVDDDLSRSVAIIGQYGCEATGYPWKDRINKSSVAEYAILKYRKELEEKLHRKQS